MKGYQRFDMRSGDVMGGGIEIDVHTPCSERYQVQCHWADRVGRGGGELRRRMAASGSAFPSTDGDGCLPRGVGRTPVRRTQLPPGRKAHQRTSAELLFYFRVWATLGAAAFAATRTAPAPLMFRRKLRNGRPRRQACCRAPRDPEG